MDTSKLGVYMCLYEDVRGPWRVLGNSRGVLSAFRRSGCPVYIEGSRMLLSRVLYVSLRGSRVHELLY